MRCSLQFVILTVTLTSFAVGGEAQPPTQDDAAVVAAFKAFAELEATRLRPKWEAMVDAFIVDPKGVPIPLSLPRKYMFAGVKLEAAPTTYSFDVRRTNSLVTPFVGDLEWPLVFLKATTHAKGPAEFCNGQALKTCLGNGGELVETAIMYRNSATRVPHTLKYEYVYQDNEWKPKRTLDEVLAETIASMNLAQPVTPSRAPSILGIPVPTATPEPE